MRIESYLDRQISRKLTEANAKRDSDHVSSGKLSAGQLGKPVLWQILKTLGVPKKEIDGYTLRKFLRGSSIEEWLVGVMPDIVETQKFLEYGDCIGYADAIVDTKNYDFKVGVIPFEIKSVTNAKFKNILFEKEPSRSHALQGCFYAMAMNVDSFGVVYVASDDLRTETYIVPVKDYIDEVLLSIKEYNEALILWQRDGILPVFEAREKWQEQDKYSDYPEFTELETSQEVYDLAKAMKGGNL